MYKLYETITWIAFFASVFGMYYVFMINRNKERMALIEKGANAGLFYSEKERQLFPWSWSKVTLKIGMFAIGIAFGIFLAAFLVDVISIHEAALYFSSILFFGGLSMVFYYIIMDRKSK